MSTRKFGVVGLACLLVAGCSSTTRSASPAASGSGNSATASPPAGDRSGSPSASPPTTASSGSGSGSAKLARRGHRAGWRAGAGRLRALLGHLHRRRSRLGARQRAVLPGSMHLPPPQQGRRKVLAGRAGSEGSGVTNRGPECRSGVQRSVREPTPTAGWPVVRSIPPTTAERAGTRCGSARPAGWSPPWALPKAGPMPPGPVAAPRHRRTARPPPRCIRRQSVPTAGARCQQPLGNASPRTDRQRLPLVPGRLGRPIYSGQGSASPCPDRQSVPG